MKYNAFISYRHSELDMYIAKKVHKGLETFKVPAAVAKKCGKKKIERVFRDQEELPIGSDLNDNISGALANSEWLLVICSPRTPESYWVKKEITSFIEMHDREHVLAILIEGEPDESFPPELLTDENGNPVEPLAADVRGKTKGEINKKFRTEIMRLAAPVLGCSFDDLRQRHRERRLKKAMALMAAAALVVSGLGIGFGIYNANMVKQIKENYAEKQVNQSRYLAKTSENLLENGDRRAATLVALVALPSEENDRPYVGEAEYALTDALSVYDTGNVVSPFRILSHDVTVKSMVYSDDGNYLTTVLSDESYSVWNVPEGKQAYYHPGFFDENDRIIFSRYVNVIDKKFFMVTDHELYVYSFEDEELYYEEFGPMVHEAIVCAETAQLAIFTDKLIIYDGKNLEKVKEIDAPDGISSVSKMAFSADGKYIAVDNFDIFGTNSAAAVFNIESGKAETYTLSEGVVSKLIVDNKGTLFAASYTNSAYLGNYGDGVSVSAEKFEHGSAEAVWRFNTLIDNSTFSDASILMTAVFDSDGNYEPMISVASKIYSLNGKTGAVIAQAATSSYIRSLLANSSSRIGFAAEKDGHIDFYNFDTGAFYTSNVIDAKTQIAEILLRNSHLVIRPYFSPDIKVYTYQQGDGMQEIYTAQGDNINAVIPNDDESMYCSKVGYGSEGTSYDFYKSEDDSYVGSMIIDDGSIIRECYVGTKFYVFSNKGIIYVFDTSDVSTTKWDFDEISYIAAVNISGNGKYALLRSSAAVYIVDLEIGKTTSTILQNAFAYCAVVANDGKTVFYADEEGLSIYDIASDTVTSGKFEYSDMSKSNGNVDKCIVLDEERGQIAIACIDCYVRVYDINSGDMLCEAPFNTFVRAFVAFSKDGKYLYLQGDDYVFRIFDIEEEQFVYIAGEQMNEIRDIRETLDGSEITIHNVAEMVTMNLADFSLKNHVTGGKMYLKNHSKVYVSYYKTLYSFPAVSLEELIKKAQTIYADDPLTYLEMLEYSVE